MSFTMRMDRKHRSLYDLNPIASPFSLSSQANGRLSSPRRSLQSRGSASGLRRGSSQEVSFPSSFLLSVKLIHSPNIMWCTCLLQKVALDRRQSFKGAMARKPPSAALEVNKEKIAIRR